MAIKSKDSICLCICLFADKIRIVAGRLHVVEVIMHYKVLFRIEKIELVEKLKHKLRNYRRYLQETGDTAEIEIVFAGNVVQIFSDLNNDFVGDDVDIALCHNALSGSGMPDVFHRNVRTVRAGIGEIITRKSQGFIEYTIE